MQNIEQRFSHLNNKTSEVISAVEKGISWLEQHGEQATKHSKQISLNDNKRTLTKVIKALQKRPSIAIFGQSQVGKSFLVRSLASSPITSKLEVINSVTNERIDFLQKINPPGGRESTGIITRFSTSRPENINPNYPFKVELLSQLDIAAILINGYIEDIQDYIEDLDKEEIINKVAELKSEVNSNTNDLKVDEIYDFNDYLITNFSDDYRIKYCQEIGYFNDLIKLLPKISYNKRWELLHFFWGKNNFLTNLFNRLSETLYRLDFTKVAYVDNQAIINGRKDPKFGNTTNILDVERIKEIFYAEPLGKISVLNTKAEINSVSISEFSALIKELHFEIPNDFKDDTTKSFLQYTDILDFPGSKSREKVPEVVFNSNNEKAKLSMFVRGKVSYLFYLYNRDIGISTLLYCMDNEPPLVSESPGLLKKWIHNSIGSTPTLRENHQQTVKELLASENIPFSVNNVSPLLIAMTKFNVELSGKGGAETIGDPETHNSKWFARFKENFSNYMNKPVDDKWTTNWNSENDTFKFVFPIRDPGFSDSFFQGYDPINQTEQNLRPEKALLIGDMKTSFLQSEIVKDYIFDPFHLWEELLTPNKTGIDYLSKYLAPSSHPVNMLAQLRTIFKNSVSNIVKVLESEFSSGDMNEDLKKAKIDGARAFTSILSLSNNSNSPLSTYLNQIVTTENEIWRLLYEFTFVSKSESTEENIDYLNVKIFLSDLGIDINSNNVKKELLDFYEVNESDLDEILKSQINISLQELISPKLNGSNNVGEEFAEEVLSHWADKLSSVSLSNESELNKDNNRIFNTILSEILKSPLHRKINSEIASIINSELKDGITNDKFNFIATSVAAILNRFVFSSTWAFSNESEKPIQRKTNSTIFSNNSLLLSREELDIEMLNNATKNYILNFSLGVKELFKENVKKRYGIDNTFNAETNTQLGEIISQIKNL